MKLLDYLKQLRITDTDFAARLGDGVTPRAVRKWKYGESKPRLPNLLRIQEVTNGAVTPNDFLPSPPGAAREGAPAPAPPQETP